MDGNTTILGINLESDKIDLILVLRKQIQDTLKCIDIKDLQITIQEYGEFEIMEGK